MSAGDAVEIAKLQAENTGLRRDIERLEEQVRLMRAEFHESLKAVMNELHAMNMTLNTKMGEMRGTWRTLVAMASIAATLGGAVAWVLSWVFGKH